MSGRLGLRAWPGATVPNLNNTRRLVQPASPLCTARRSSARGRDRGGPLVAHQHHHPARAAVESHREQWAGGAQASLRPSRSAFGPWSSCVVGWGMGSWAPAAWVVGAPLRWQGSSSGAAAVAVAVAVAAAGLLETVTGPCQCLCVCTCVVRAPQRDHDVCTRTRTRTPQGAGWEGF